MKSHRRCSFVPAFSRSPFVPDIHWGVTHTQRGFALPLPHSILLHGVSTARPWRRVRLLCRERCVLRCTRVCTFCLWGIYSQGESLVIEEAYGQLKPNSFQLVALIYVTNRSPKKKKKSNCLISSPDVLWGHSGISLWSSSAFS